MKRQILLALALLSPVMALAQSSPGFAPNQTLTAAALNNAFVSKQDALTFTGTGNSVRATSPTLVTPALGTPSAVVLTNGTGLPASTGIIGILPAANGGAGAISGALKGNGSGLVTQAACADLSNGASGCSTTVGTIATQSAAAVALTGGTINGVTIGGVTPAAGTFSTLTASGITGSTQCLHVNTSGVLSGTGSDCGSGGGGGLTVGSTGITSGTDTKVLFDNSGVLGEYTVTGSGNVVMSTSPTLVTPALGTPSAAVLTNATGLPLTSGVTGVLPVANGGTNCSSATITCFNNVTGLSAAGTTGTTSTNLVFSTSPTLITPALGTPSAAVLTNGTGLPLTSGVTGVLPVANGGTNCSSATITCFNNVTGLSAAGTTGTTSTNLVFSTSPTLVTPALGTPSAAVLTNATGLPLTTGVTGILPAANGGAGAISGALKGNGSGLVTQAACADLSNAAASCSTDATNATNISSGTLAAARGGAGTVNGIEKANGSGVVSAAVAGTDYQAPFTLTCGSANLLCSGSPGNSPSISSTVASNVQSGSGYTIVCSTDASKVILRTNTGGAETDTLGNVSATGCGTGFGTMVCTASSQQDTISVTSPSTINGSSTLVVPANTCVAISDPDGTNYVALAQNYNATLITSGTLAAARGGAGTINGALKGNGSGTVSQAACADLSNAAATCSTDATNATNISSGTLANARLTGTGSTTVNSQTCTLGSTCTAWSTVGYNWATTLAGNTTGYTCVFSCGIAAGQTTPVFTRMNTNALSGTYGHLHAAVATAPGSGNTVIVTFETCSGNTTCSDSALTCTIADTATTCGDDTHTVVVAADALISMKYVSSASATTTGGQAHTVGWHQ